eukprot:jgi/Mesvir1/18569/Mv17080-RA.2
MPPGDGWTAGHADRLRCLDLSDVTSVDDAAVADVILRLTALQALSLASTRITDRTLDALTYGLRVDDYHLSRDRWEQQQRRQQRRWERGRPMGWLVPDGSKEVDGPYLIASKGKDVGEPDLTAGKGSGAPDPVAVPAQIGRHRSCVGGPQVSGTGLGKRRAVCRVDGGRGEVAQEVFREARGLRDSHACGGTGSDDVAPGGVLGGCIGPDSALADASAAPSSTAVASLSVTAASAASSAPSAMASPAWPLSRLRHLRLSATAIGNTSIPYLLAFRRLEYLDVRGTDVHGHPLQVLAAKHSLVPLPGMPKLLAASNAVAAAALEGHPACACPVNADARISPAPGGTARTNNPNPPGATSRIQYSPNVGASPYAGGGAGMNFCVGARIRYPAGGGARASNLLSAPGPGPSRGPGRAAEGLQWLSVDSAAPPGACRRSQRAGSNAGAFNSNSNTNSNSNNNSNNYDNMAFGIPGPGPEVCAPDLEEWEQAGVRMLLEAANRVSERSLEGHWRM